MSIKTPMQTPIKDLMNNALKHYEEASTALHHWNSDIPKAIKHYYLSKLRKEDAPPDLSAYEDAGYRWWAEWDFIGKWVGKCIHITNNIY